MPGRNNNITASNSNSSSYASQSPFFAPSTSKEVSQRTPGGSTTKRIIRKAVIIENKSTLVGATANLINAIVGSGIVGIPYAMQQAGLLTGIFLVCLCALLTEKSLRLLVHTAKHSSAPSYETVMEAAFGRPGFLFVSINMFIMAYGAMVSYLMIVKETLPYVFGVTDDLGMRRAILFCLSITIMVPLSAQRDMANLAQTSRISVILDIIMVCLVTYLSIPNINMAWQQAGGLWNLVQSVSTLHFDTVFVGLGVLSFAFVCQHSAFIIAGSLDRPTTTRWGTVTLRALWVCAGLANLCGTAGFLGYGTATQGNILNNLDAHGLLPNLARALLGTTMLFVYPMESFVARHVCVVTLFAGRRAHEGDDATILNRRDRRIALTVALYVLALVPAMLFENLGNVLSVTGAIGGSCLSYIGPGAVYIGIYGSEMVGMVQRFWNFGPASLGTIPNTAITNQDSSMINNPNNYYDNVELQPLHATTTTATDGTAQRRDSLLITCSKTILWYTLGMPMWYAMAQIGSNGYIAYRRELATKSPHASRLGRQQPPERQHDMVRPAGGGGGGGGGARLTSSYQQQGGGGLPASLILPPTNPAALLKPVPPPVSSNEPDDDDDDNDESPPPQAVDFIIAVGYILFGMVALCAGLLSIYVAETATRRQRY